MPPFLVCAPILSATLMLRAKIVVLWFIVVIKDLFFILYSAKIAINGEPRN